MFAAARPLWVTRLAPHSRRGDTVRGVFSYAEKVVLITGTARGCGAVLAEAFANAGATVVGCDRDAEAGKATTEEIRGAGGRMDFVATDVSREEEVKALVDGALDAHGRLDCAINNAGTEQLSEIAEGTESAFDELIATDLKGLFFCLKHEINAMRTGGGGSILNMSSVTSSITAAPANGLYAATKGGVNGLTKAAAIEVGKDNINVNALAFAAIDIPDDMIWRYLDEQKVPKEALLQAFPVGRMGRPEELVGAVMYLCSDEARFCTGTILILDGGFTAQ
jgi:NAD(P)-dependent dehydrogenase (short-subunit alcohol dehydrogenase family)